MRQKRLHRVVQSLLEARSDSGADARDGGGADEQGLVDPGTVEAACGDLMMKKAKRAKLRWDKSFLIRSAIFLFVAAILLGIGQHFVPKEYGTIFCIGFGRVEGVARGFFVLRHASIPQ